MNRMRVYVSGKMTGLPDHGAAKFAEATSRLRAAGYTVISPSEMDGGKPLEWHEYLRRDLRLLSEVDAIALLDNWRDSRGAQLEVLVALRLGMKVIDAQTMEEIDMEHNVDFFISKEIVLSA